MRNDCMLTTAMHRPRHVQRYASESPRVERTTSARHSSARPTPRPRQQLTSTAQVMKDEAGRPFIIVREYVAPTRGTSKRIGG
jgi:hypothetical protein